MLEEPSELDMAQLKADMRTLYRHVGFGGSLQVLYEMMLGARTLAEIIDEEKRNEDVKDGKGA